MYLYHEITKTPIKALPPTPGKEKARVLLIFMTISHTCPEHLLSNAHFDSFKIQFTPHEMLTDLLKNGQWGANTNLEISIPSFMMHASCFGCEPVPR